ncbi:MAG TPA: DUF2007 domain-containing protein [Dehalococcoidia bacterium]|nr:DUF2007 domain-containing protein [Dehalococcoidia bacterium]
MGKESEGERLVKVASVSNEAELSILDDALRQEGIPTHVRRADFLIPAIVPSPTPTFEIYVFAKDVKRALWVIGEAEG